MELIYKPIAEFRKEYKVYANFYLDEIGRECRLYAYVVKKTA